MDVDSRSESAKMGESETVPASMEPRPDGRG